MKLDFLLHSIQICIFLRRKLANLFFVLLLGPSNVLIIFFQVYCLPGEQDNGPFEGPDASTVKL